MRIALVGNMNNNLFSLARYLRDIGQDVRLYIFNRNPSHFHPSTDTFSDDYITFTEYLDWSKETFHFQNWIRISEKFSKYHIVICDGIAPAFFYKAGINVDFFIPFGGDLYSLPFYKPQNNLKFWLAKIKRLLTHGSFILPKESIALAQLNGIRKSKYLVSLDTSWEEVISKIESRHNWIKLPIPIVYNRLDFKNVDVKQNEHLQIFNKLRAKNELLIFSHSRHYWKNHDNLKVDRVSNKGNDIFIQAFAGYLKVTKALAHLVLLEYGPDVDFSKELIRKLQIENAVTWLPIQPRKNIMYMISLSDLIANEFVNSWIGGGVIYEALAIGKPLIGFRDDSRYIQKGFKNLYPMINAKSEQEIVKALNLFSENQKIYQDMGREGKDWYNEEIVTRSLDFFKRYFNNVETSH